MEKRLVQKANLYDMMKARRDSVKIGDSTRALDELINRAEATMEPEDVIWVEKKRAQLP